MTSQFCLTSSHTQNSEIIFANLSDMIIKYATPANNKVKEKDDEKEEKKEKEKKRKKEEKEKKQILIQMVKKQKLWNHQSNFVIRIKN